MKFVLNKYGNLMCVFDGTWYCGDTLSQQKEFAQRVTEICELEAAQSSSCQRLEDLFQAMLHQTFRGEL